MCDLTAQNWFSGSWLLVTCFIRGYDANRIEVTHPDSIRQRLHHEPTLSMRTKSGIGKFQFWEDIGRSV